MLAVMSMAREEGGLGLGSGLSLHQSVLRCCTQQQRALVLARVGPDHQQVRLLGLRLPRVSSSLLFIAPKQVTVTMVVVLTVVAVAAVVSRPSHLSNSSI